MVRRDRTKQMFAEELERMLEEMPLDSIKVVDLCKRCEITPQSFYYHFQDKYDLISWIYMHYAVKVMSAHRGVYDVEQIRETAVQWREKKSLFRKLFSDTSQNNALDFATQKSIEYLIDNSKALAGGGKLSPYQILEIKGHVYSWMAILKEWVFDQIDADEDTLAQYLYDQTPDWLRPVIARMNEVVE